jgi:hypothetical protein
LSDNLTVLYDPSDDTTLIAWDVDSAGGLSLRYDVLRSGDPSDFRQQTVCLVSDGTQRFISEPSPSPNPHPLLSVYIVRAQNGCEGTDVDNIGTSSDGTPRQARRCP